MIFNVIKFGWLFKIYILHFISYYVHVIRSIFSFRYLIICKLAMSVRTRCIKLSYIILNIAYTISNFEIIRLLYLKLYSALNVYNIDLKLLNYRICFWFWTCNHRIYKNSTASVEEFDILYILKFYIFSQRYVTLIVHFIELCNTLIKFWDLIRYRFWKRFLDRFKHN